MTAGRGRNGRWGLVLVIGTGLVLSGCTAAVVDRAVTATTAAVLEAGGGGSTFPQQALNDPYGLSAARANCMLCHSVDPDVDAFRFSDFGEDWRTALFDRIDPDAEDIFDPTQSQRDSASTDPRLVASDSDSDG